MANPWGTHPVHVGDDAGQPVTHMETGGNVSFPTTAGHTYESLCSRRRAVPAACAATTAVSPFR
jgi:hypothetical protein